MDVRAHFSISPLKADKRKTLGRAIFLLFSKSKTSSVPEATRLYTDTSIQQCISVQYDISVCLINFFVCLFGLCSVSYAKAAFCLEELMMTNPHNHLYCEQYAEVP